ncbi:hypothetical protein [Candidatus Poriferisodalis sp.]|uniref:hypothetical protein n=1 Tax=Candidatus Poriferisodalis sp. TaxID=3101277 RepID=UPI003C6EAAAE
MLRKLVLGTLIALIGAVIGVVAFNVWNQWRGDSDPSVKAVGVPAVHLPPLTPPELEPSTADLDDGMTATVTSEMVTTPTVGEQQMPSSAPDPALHPQVQLQAMEIVETIVEEHTETWNWLDPALNAAQLNFFEELPASCASAIGCYNYATGEVWLSLDALRIEHKSYNPYEGPSSSDIVLHELAHAYTRSTSEGRQLLSQFIAHYAGCRSDRDGLSTDRLAVELIADTMAIAAMRTTEDPSRMSIINTRALGELDYGYFREGGFDGCLTDSREPDPALVEGIYATAFNCESEHALDVFEANHELALGLSVNELTILKTCYGIECDASGDCQGWSEADPRQTAAGEIIRHRTCADGLIHPGTFLERPGWESFCGRAYVPDDVECVGDLNGNEPDPEQAGPILPGTLGTDGGCVVNG